MITSSFYKSRHLTQIVKQPFSQISNKLNLSALSLSVCNAKKRIIARGDTIDSTMEHQLDLLDKLTEFELGRFMLINKGLNGFWMHYMQTYTDNPIKARYKLEKHILEDFPLIIALQERYKILLKHSQLSVKNGAKFAAIASGLTSELLHLNFEKTSDIKLFAVDSDKYGLKDFIIYAKKNGLENKCYTISTNPWNINYENFFDLISSNELIIYEHSDRKIKQLYSKFYQALKPGGKLMTSTLTPPLLYDVKSEWDMSKVDLKNLKLQRIVFHDIIQLNWHAFRSTELVKNMLISIGFENIIIEYDKAKIFPTIIAQRPL